jgi:4-amino-4-deoxy-L-arabinose transferase-like glycosyltransferase
MLRGRSLRFWRTLGTARVFLLPAALLLCVTLPHLAQGDWRGDAGWYSAIGLGAWRSGHLWTLYGEPGIAYFNKPPLAFWIHGFVLYLTGPALWAARLPTVFAALACELLTVDLARQLAGRRAAVFSGIVLALTYEFFRRTREVSLDMWQLVFLLAALWCVARGVVRPANRRGSAWIVAAGVPLGLALLTKPLMGLAFVPISGAWLVWNREARRLPALAGATLVAAAVAAPWHLSMVALHGREFTGQYFGAEIADRAAGRLQAGHAEPPPVWFYASQIARTYWPWLACAGLFVAMWARGAMPARQARAARLAVVWTLVWLILLTAYPDRRDRYALVLFPGLALMCGLWLGATGTGRVRRLQRAGLRAAAPISLLAAVAFALAPVRMQGPPERHWREFDAWVSSHGEAGKSPELWQGAIGGAQGARIYLEHGAWPRTTRDRHGSIVRRPPRGALLVYHARGGAGPGPGETVMFASTPDAPGRTPDLRVTRLDAEAWSPVAQPDPGE